RILHAVVWPKRLRPALYLNFIKCILTLMVGGETDVLLRVPILTGHHKVKFILHAVYHGNNGVAIGHGQAAAGHKIILGIYYYQGFHLLKIYVRLSIGHAAPLTGYLGLFYRYAGFGSACTHRAIGPNAIGKSWRS